MDLCLKAVKESNKTKLDSYQQCQEQCIDNIPYYLSGLSLAHFSPITFLEIAVFPFMLTGSYWRNAIAGKIPSKNV